MIDIYYKNRLYISHWSVYLIRLSNSIYTRLVSGGSYKFGWRHKWNEQDVPTSCSFHLWRHPSIPYLWPGKAWYISIYLSLYLPIYLIFTLSIFLSIYHLFWRCKMTFLHPDILGTACSFYLWRHLNFVASIPYLWSGEPCICILFTNLNKWALI